MTTTEILKELQEYVRKTGFGTINGFVIAVGIYVIALTEKSI